MSFLINGLDHISSAVASLGFTPVSELLSGYPISKALCAMAVPAALLIAYHFLASENEQIKDLVKSSETLITNKQYTQAEAAIERFVDDHLVIIQGDKNVFVGTDKNRDFLFKKLKMILIDSEITHEGKTVIIQNVLENFEHLLESACDRVSLDLNNTELATRFGLGDHPVLESIGALGDETHNEGKIVLLLTFQGGKEVVYKPRSMEVERLLCGGEESLFAKVGLGTYEVLCREDLDREEYGYSEFIRNREGENQIRSEEELRDYYEKIAMLERVGQELGLSDLHYQNIITANRTPYVIDAEVFLVPNVPTGIIGENGAAYIFDAGEGGMKEWEGKNKVWINPSIMKAEYSVKPDELLNFGIDVGEMAEGISFTQDVEEKIQSIRAELMTRKSRIIVVATNVLKGLSFRLDPLNFENHTIFLDTLQKELNTSGFTFIEEAEGAILEGIKRDSLHHDVPVFYYDPIAKTVHYHDSVIGELDEGNGVAAPL